MTVQKRILELCQERKMSLSKLANDSGLAETTVYDWFNKKNRTPSIKALEDVCAVFQISLAQFFSGVDFNALPQNEIHLLEIFRKIPDKNKEKALSMLEMLID